MRAMSRFVLRHKGAVVVILLDATVVRALQVPAPPPPAQPAAHATARRLAAEPAHRELGAHE